MKTPRTPLLERLAAIAAKLTVPDPIAKAIRAGNIVAKADAAEEATVYLYDMIGPEDWGGVSAKSFVAALGGVKGAKTLHLRMNSVGGSVFEAKAIYQQLREWPGNKVCHVDGLAASAASFVAMGCDKIVTAPHATWMIHNAQGIAWGDGNALRDVADVLDMESANIRAIYAARTGCSDADLKSLMDAETFMTAAEAKDRGFTDEIAGEEDDPADDPADETDDPKASASALSRIVAISADTETLRRRMRVAAAVEAANRVSRAGLGAK